MDRNSEPHEHDSEVAEEHRQIQRTNAYLLWTLNKNKVLGSYHLFPIELFASP